jgi:hypothetical protein
MLKAISLVFISILFTPLAHAEHWRYCAANAPESTPCKAFVASVISGRVPDTDSKEVPRYASANPVSLAINPLQTGNETGNVPSFGHAPSSALQPFVQMTALILVR